MHTRSWRFWLAALAFLQPVRAVVAQSSSIDSVFEEARTLYRQRGPANLHQAIVLFRQAESGYREQREPGSEAEALRYIGSTFSILGQPDSALAHYRAALPLFVRAGERTGEGVALNQIGDLFFNAGRPDSALAYYTAALAPFRAAGDRIGESFTLGNIGNTHADQSRPDSALAYYRAVLAIHRADAGQSNIHRPVDARAGEATALGSIGRVFGDLGLRDSALLYYEMELAIQREIENHDGVARTLNNIGHLLTQLARPDSALRYYQAALSLARERGLVVQQGVTLHNIASVLHIVGRSDSALVLYRAALVVWREIGARRGEGNTRNGIAGIFEAKGMLDSAAVHLDMALALARGTRNRAGEGQLLNNIGNLHSKAGRLDSALSYFRASLPIRRETRDRPGEGSTLNNIGAALLETAQPDSALAYYHAALAIHREVGNRAGEVNTLSNIGVALYQTTEIKDTERATAYFDTAATISASIRLSSGEDANRIGFAETQTSITTFWALAWLARKGEVPESLIAASALAATERGRAQTLLDLLRRTADSAIGLNAYGTHLTQAGANLAAETDRFLAPLRGRRTAALSYLIADDTLVIWMLTPAGHLQVSRALVDLDTLVAHVQSLRAGLGADSARGAMTIEALDQEEVSGLGIRGNAGGFRRAVTALSSMLLPPDLAALVPAGTELVIVPHTYLGLVPFALLTMGRGNEPLGLRNPLRFAPSFSALSAIEKSPAPDRAALIRDPLVVGNPSMPTVRSDAGASLQLRPLPAAQHEGETLAARLGSAALTGSAATETTVRQRLPGARLVHLATHGLAYGSEAWVRSSYLALAPDSIHDGLLTLGELVDDPTLQLTAELVVLSACQTGLGNLKQAEGTVGLQRGLLARGARSALVSLWSVDDRATGLLMDRFYTHWLEDPDHPGKSEALRRAQADVRSRTEFEHPRFWAAFQLVGAN